MKTWLPHRNYEPQYLRLVSDQTSASQAESTDQDKGSSLQRMPEAEEQTVTNPSGEVVASEDPVVPEEPLWLNIFLFFLTFCSWWCYEFMLYRAKRLISRMFLKKIPSWKIALLEN
ncbi:hypothetical protein PR202_ga04063 [Eleusine coracana subsp. coracana]|uniref:Uncharacterized protein n=1 Tax=Eleusine coracana subsp. coracana TaxID=191504 RepID=A0AAV5BS54_ELECO|nr:hypothetical protein PR202_ga04063 [Eleusine coracana subsp. coracana]